jgi:hypothetical protein
MHGNHPKFMTKAELRDVALLKLNVSRLPYDIGWVEAIEETSRHLWYEPLCRRLQARSRRFSKPPPIATSICIHLCLDSRARLLQPSNSAPSKVRGVLGSSLRRQWFLIIWSRHQAADAMSARLHLVRSKNDSTGHKTMTLLKRKVTARITVNRSCLPSFALPTI